MQCCSSMSGLSTVWATSRTGYAVLIWLSIMLFRYEEYVPRKRRREQEEAKLLRLRGVGLLSASLLESVLVLQ